MIKTATSLVRKWKASRYNWVLPIEQAGGGGAVYNAFTGACIDFSKNDFERISRLLDNPSGGLVDFRSLGENAVSLGGILIAGGLLIDADFDELFDLETRCKSKETALPLVITINPTFACNLGCGYCFVGKKQGTISEDTEQDLIRFVEQELASDDVPSFNVDWFGGEPLLARRRIERLSKAFLDLCEVRSIPYRAQIITNATLLNPNLVEPLKAWGINKIQVTLDGSRDTHNVRRPWKGISEKAMTRLSYDDTLRGLESVIGHFAIRLGVNVDSKNLDEAFDLLTIFDERGWLSPDMRFYPYPAMVSDFTEAAKAGWSAEEACERNRFYQVHSQWLEFLNARGVPVSGERLYGFPEPTTVSCGAVSSRGWVVNFDGQLHRCGFDSDTDSRAVGSLRLGTDKDNENVKYWSNYEPLSDEVCRECRALPVCLGGCARDRRDKQSDYLSANCELHLEREPKIIAQHVRMRRENRQNAREFV